MPSYFSLQASFTWDMFNLVSLLLWQSGEVLAYQAHFFSMYSWWPFCTNARSHQITVTCSSVFIRKLDNGFQFTGGLCNPAMVITLILSYQKSSFYGYVVKCWLSKQGDTNLIPVYGTWIFRNPHYIIWISSKSSRPSPIPLQKSYFFHQSSSSFFFRSFNSFHVILSHSGNKGQSHNVIM